MDCHTTETRAKNTPKLLSRALLFSSIDCTVTANGIEVSYLNGDYTQNNYLDTNFSLNKEAKNTCSKCQHYIFEENAGNFTTQTFTDGEIGT